MTADLNPLRYQVVIGSFSLINITPNLAAFSSGISAAGVLFDTIDRIPPIDIFDEEGKTPESVSGDIELKGINFFYPSRPTVQVLKDLSCKFPKGKHTALVGRCKALDIAVTVVLINVSIRRLGFW